MASLRQLQQSCVPVPSRIMMRVGMKGYKNQQVGIILQARAELTRITTRVMAPAPDLSLYKRRGLGLSCVLSRTGGAHDLR